MYKNILIKSVNWVGDTILTTPSIHRLSENYPDAQITVIARPWVAGLLKNNPDIDSIIEVDERKSCGEYIQLIKKIRKGKYDLGVLFPNSFSSAFLLRAGGVKEILGYNRDGRGFMLTKKVPVTEDILKVHQVDYYLNIIKDVCPKETRKKLELFTDPASDEFISQKLKRDKLLLSDFIVGLNPGAFYGSAKRWYPERYTAVCDYLVEKYNAKIVIIGTDKETDIAKIVMDLAKNPQNFYNYAGQTNLLQLLSLIKIFKLFLTNDSGAMHIGAAFDVPLVAVFGSTDPITTPPYSDNALIVRKAVECSPCLLRHCPTDHKCMQLVSVEDVISAVESLIKQGVIRL